MKRYLKLTVILVAAVFVGLVIMRGRATEAQTQTQTAGQHYKNIKVLNDMPADQLGRVMNLWAASLGVDCDFCHNTKDFSSDEKRTKLTARQMVKMTMNINKENFNGRPRITCNACHNGHEEPRSVPDLNAVAEPEERPKQPDPKPSAEQIIDKYAAAIGGAEKLAKVTSRVETATRTDRDNSVRQETLFYTPGHYALKTVYPQTTVTEVYDGSEAMKWARQPITLRQDEKDQIKREADVSSPTALRAAYTKIDFGGLDKINGRDVNVLIGTTAGNQREALFFDAATGLLVRRTMSSQTIFGRFPYQVDYSDYKSFGGIKIPTTIKYSMPNLSWTRHILNVKINAPVDAAVFAGPKA